MSMDYLNMESGPKLNLKLDFNWGDGINRHAVDISGLLKGKEGEVFCNQVVGYEFVLEALKKANLLINEYLKLDDGERASIKGKALFECAMIQYCKCYQKNEGWTVTLQDQAVLKSEDPNLKHAHKFFLNLRHTYVAHGGKTNFHQARMQFIVRTEPPNQIDGLFVMGIEASNLEEEIFNDFLKLIDAATRYASFHKNKVEKILFRGCVDGGWVVNPELIKP